MNLKSNICLFILLYVFLFSCKDEDVISDPVIRNLNIASSVKAGEDLKFAMFLGYTNVLTVEIRSADDADGEPFLAQKFNVNSSKFNESVGIPLTFSEGNYQVKFIATGLPSTAEAIELRDLEVALSDLAPVIADFKAPDYALTGETVNVEAQIKNGLTARIVLLANGTVVAYDNVNLPSSGKLSYDLLIPEGVPAGEYLIEVFVKGDEEIAETKASKSIYIYLNPNEPDFSSACGNWDNEYLLVMLYFSKDVEIDQNLYVIGDLVGGGWFDSEPNSDTMFNKNSDGSFCIRISRDNIKVSNDGVVRFMVVQGEGNNNRYVDCDYFDWVHPQEYALSDLGDFLIVKDIDIGKSCDD
jgi:hypothetical protein